MNDDSKKDNSARDSWTSLVGQLLRKLYEEQRKRPHTWAGRAITAAEKLARRLGL